jgi:hypothetical protein
LCWQQQANGSAKRRDKNLFHVNWFCALASGYRLPQECRAARPQSTHRFSHLLQFSAHFLNREKTIPLPFLVVERVVRRFESVRLCCECVRLYDLGVRFYFLGIFIRDIGVRFRSVWVRHCSVWIFIRHEWIFIYNVGIRFRFEWIFMYDLGVRLRFLGVRFCSVWIFIRSECVRLHWKTATLSCLEIQNLGFDTRIRLLFFQVLSEASLGSFNIPQLESPLLKGNTATGW